jgi:hypothetical protein
MKKSILAAWCCLVFTSCSSNGPSQEEYQQLKKENEVLTQQLDQCQNGSVHLLEGARILLKRRDFPNALSTLQDLLRRHPDSEEAKEARKLVETTKVAAKKATAAEEAKADKLAVLGEKKKAERSRIEAKYLAIINTFQGETFDATAFQERMKREGFKQIGGDYSNNFDGRYKGHSVVIKYGGATASSNGWVQHWDVVVD